MLIIMYTLKFLNIMTVPDPTFSDIVAKSMLIE